MAAQKFASDFESLVNQSNVQDGLFCDLGDCKQIDYGIVKGSGTVTAGKVELVSRRDINHPYMRVAGPIDLSALTDFNTRGFQSSEPRPHGAQFGWVITEAIIGGTITCTINGQHQNS